MEEALERAFGGSSQTGRTPSGEARAVRRLVRAVVGTALLVAVMLIGFGFVQSGRWWGLWLGAGAVGAMLVLFGFTVWRHVPRGRGLRAFRPEELEGPRSAGSFCCVRCGYAIGDLPAYKPSGDATILCPECGLVNRLPVVGPPICGACGEALGRRIVPAGTVLHCPKCRVAWRIRV